MFNLRNGLVLSGLVLGVSLVSIATSAGTAQAQSYNDYNYVGGGISDEGFVINGKARVTRSLSLRPAAIVDYDFDNATFLIPVTYDAPAFEVGDADLLPFGGIGARVSTGGDDTDFGLLLTGGADYRFTERWTANGSINLTFIDDTDIDFVAGVGYTF